MRCVQRILQAETAAKAAEEARAKAQSEASAMVSKAKKDADTIVQDAQAYADRIAGQQDDVLKRLDKAKQAVQVAEQQVFEHMLIHTVASVY